MRKETADKLAETVGGYAYNSGGGIYLVILERPDGMLVVFSDKNVCLYEDRAALDAGEYEDSIYLV